MRKRYVPIFALFALFLPGVVLAQTAETGVIEGRIVDDTAQPVAAASVQLAQSDGAYARSTATNESGVFRVGFLPPGLYDVTVRLIGYRTTTVTGVRVQATKIATVTIELETAPVEVEELRVEATRDLIDRETTEFTTTLETDQVDLLPAARTATDLIKFTPGARPDQVFGGSTAQANAYLLDGVVVNQPGFGGDFLLPNVDWIEEVVVKGLGAGAEYGNFQGGLFNLVTKSGDNTYRGQLRFNFEGEDFAATNINTVEAGSELDARFEVNGEFRGPIVRDRLFFYISAQEVRSDIRVVDLFAGTEDEPAFLPRMEERREFKLLGKLTWQATNRDIFNVYVGKDDVYTDNNGLNSIDAPETVTEQESPATFFNASWQRTFSDRLLFELKVTGYSGRNDLLPLNGQLPSVQVLGGNRNEFRNAIFTREREPQSLAFSANWDAFLNTGDITHRLKFGATLDFGSWLERRQRNGNITWRPELPEGGLDAFDPNDPSTWGFISTDWAGNIRLDASTLNGGIYVQDYMQINESLSINPGLRLGFWEGDLDPRDGESFTAVEDVKLAPRIGVVYDVDGEGEWVLKGHYGRYYQNLFALMFDRAAGGDVFERTEFWDWIGDGLPDIDREYTESEREQLFDFFGRSSAFETGPVEDYNQPYVDQFVAGVEKAIGDTWKAGVVYVHRENHDILALQDRNLATNYTEFNDISVIDFREDAPVLDESGNPLVLDRLFISNDDILFVGGAPGLTDEEVAGLTFEEDLVLTTAEDAER
ncbi:MAG: TonB-dependent receptor, partial [Halobacteriales archaeon]|nr:TonB-dependent receptor [Halobacteriales archaeon]